MSSMSEIWDRLVHDGDAAPGYIRLRIPEVTCFAAYAARNTQTGSEALVVEAATEAIPGSVEWPRSTGFAVTPEALEPGRRGRTRLILGLSDPRYQDVFRSLCDDLVRRIMTAEDASSGIRLLIAQLARWQAFLRAAGHEGLSLEVRRGLAGELLFLRDVLFARAGDAAVSGWTGPLGADHDFQLAGGNVEVKSTSANTPHTFRVSNVGQLDDTSTPALYLCVTMMDETLNQGESLTEIVDTIRSAVSPLALNVLDDRLAVVGYFGGTTDPYPSPRYTVIDRRLYRVSAGFPRIERGDLASGVEEVQYSVALAACRPHSVTLDEALNVILSEGG